MADIQNLLRVENLCGGYGTVNILGGVSICVAAGELVGLVGLNGSGKSTVIGGVAGLLPDCRADVVTLCGENLTHMSAVKRSRAGMGVLLQNGQVFQNMTIKDNLTLAGTVFPGASPFSDSALQEVWERLRVRANTLAGNLSGGEQRLLGLGMAMMRHPRVLLADEPTLGVWKEIRGRVVDELKDYARRNSCGVVIVGHDWEALAAKCDSLLLLKQGRIVDAMRGASFEERLRRMRELTVLEYRLTDIRGG